MKKIEKKIIEKIYQLEIKKIAIEIFLRIISIIFFGLALIVFGEIFFDILKKEKTLDVFQIFFEDFEVIKKYFFETIYIFYLELPKIILALFLILLSIFFYLFLRLIKNFNKIKNKVNSLIKFKRKKI